MSSFRFDAPDADLILRSGSDDSRDFRVHRCILAPASSFFSHMFTLPQPASADKCEIPVIDMSETTSTIQRLLQFIYPIPDPAMDTLDELTPVLGAAVKYEFTIAVDALRKLLAAPRFLEKYPTRVYAIASRYELESEAKLASRYTLGVNVLDCPLSDDLKYITAYAYHRLLQLHRSRAQAAQDLLRIPDEVKCMLCNGTHYGILIPPKWWRDFQDRAKEELKLRPTTDVIFSFRFLAQSAQAGCERCAGSILDSHWFLERLRKQIDELPATI